MTRTAKKHHRRAIIVLAVATLVAPIAGCATPPAAATGPMPDLPPKDAARWVMPMDEYSAALLVPLVSYAENRRMETCLNKEGFSWPIPVEPTDSASYLAFPKNVSAFPALTVAIAKQYGYTAPYWPGPDSDPHTMVELNRIAESSPGLDPTLLACREESRKTFDGGKASDIFNTASMWRWDAAKQAYQDPAVQKSGAAWKRCLGDAGYHVSIPAPISNDEWMPTQKLGEKLGIYKPHPTVAPQPHGGLIQARGDTEGDPDKFEPVMPTPAEIELAVADATCRDSSGWTRAYYEAQWDAEVAVVQNHADQLKTMKADIEALTAQAQQIVADNPPLH